MKVVLLSGKQGSGKSTTARLLCEELETLNYRVEVIKFADPLYELHDMILGYLDGNYGIKPDSHIDGKLLQVLGTEWGRSKSEDFWVNITKKRLSELEPFTDYVIIDDARFPNELNVWDKSKTVKVRLLASEESRKHRAEKWRNSTNHPSEVGLDQYKDWSVEINTDLTDPYTVVKTILWSMYK